MIHPLSRRRPLLTPLSLLILCFATLPFHPQEVSADLLDAPASKRESHQPAKKGTRSLRKQHLAPSLLIGPAVHRQDDRSSTQKAILQQFLKESDRILSPNWSDQGTIRHAWLGRIFVGEREKVLVHLKQPAPPGTTFMIYRVGLPLTDPWSNEAMGTLANNLGTLRITGKRTGKLWQAQIIRAKREIVVGDRLLRDRFVPMDFKHNTRTRTPVQGRVLSFPDDMEMAGSQQVVIVGVGRREHAVQGLVLTVSRQAPPLSSSNHLPPFTQEDISFSQTISNATLFHIGEKASFALLGNTQQPVRRGDRISSH